MLAVVAHPFHYRAGTSSALILIPLISKRFHGTPPGVGHGTPIVSIFTPLLVYCTDFGYNFNSFDEE